MADFSIGSKRNIFFIKESRGYWEKEMLFHLHLKIKKVRAWNWRRKKGHGTGEKETIFPFEVILDPDLNRVLKKIIWHRESWTLTGYSMLRKNYLFRWGNNIVVIFKRRNTYLLEICTEICTDDMICLGSAGERKR